MPTRCTSDMAALIWQERAAERSITLDRDTIVSIGRGSSVTVTINDARVSRLHAEVAFRAGRWRLTDLGSHNGTFVNGIVVTASKALTHGDVIRCGATRIL